MKSSFRLVKSLRPTDKKQPAREQRFRYPTDEVWEVSCGRVREKTAQRRETRKAS
jgi:hypothetical protein